MIFFRALAIISYVVAIGYMIAEGISDPHVTYGLLVAIFLMLYAHDMHPLDK